MVDLFQKLFIIIHIIKSIVFPSIPAHLMTEENHKIFYVDLKGNLLCACEMQTMKAALQFGM